MKRFFRKIFMTLGLSLLLVIPLTGVAATAYAGTVSGDAKSQVCGAIDGSTNTACGQGGAELSKVFKAVLNVISVLAGAASVFMVVIAGFKYITSSGESQAVSGAKKTLIYAIIGLIVVALAQVIVHFVLRDVSK